MGPIRLGVVTHTFNPSTWKAEAKRISEFKGSLVYRVSSRTARVTKGRPDSKNKTKQKTKTKAKKKKERKKKRHVIFTRIPWVIYNYHKQPRD
jgi:hypothetical protein